MPFNVRAFSRRPLRLVLMWLLAWVLPLQGTAVGVFTALGPAHTHQAADASLVLTDFRRWKSAPVREPGFFAFSGHFHGSAMAQRHHHAHDDTSVVRTGEDSVTRSAEVEDGLNASASLASVLALMPVVVAWAPSALGDSLGLPPLWRPLTGFARPLERPPKFGRGALRG